MDPTTKNTFEARQIEIGYHPDGYRIDKTASPMNRYTRWRIVPDGTWADPTPVCFDSMPARGWLKAESFQWDSPSMAERHASHGPASSLDAGKGSHGRLIVAVASGKGGTGKTTVATNIAVTAADGGAQVQLLDCDVEAPNAHLFLRPAIERQTTVSVPVPEVDEEKCTACGECGRLCRYSAIVSLKTKPLVFPELCHGCGGCMLVCPTGAITERPREVGVVEEGRAGGVRFAGGRLRIGEAMSPPLIRGVKARAREQGLVIIDAPPGTSCPVIEAVRDADFVLLVTEPTPFGLNDLAIAVDTVRKLGLPFGVVVNRASPERSSVREYCAREGIEVLAELPDDRRVAEAYSRGELVTRALPEFAAWFRSVIEQVERRARACVS